jgi:hypothetical protein
MPVVTAPPPKQFPPGYAEFRASLEAKYAQKEYERMTKNVVPRQEESSGTSSFRQSW